MYIVHDIVLVPRHNRIKTNNAAMAGDACPTRSARGTAVPARRLHVSLRRGAPLRPVTIARTGSVYLNINYRHLLISNTTAGNAGHCKLNSWANAQCFKFCRHEQATPLSHVEPFLLSLHRRPPLPSSPRPPPFLHLSSTL